MNKERTIIYNYLKVAVRNILRHKVYSIINIAGLAIGMAVFITIMLYVRYETGHDRFHKKLDRIYRVDTGKWPVTPYYIADLLGRNIPEIESVVRFDMFHVSPIPRSYLEYNQKYSAFDNLIFADPSVFSIFTFPLKQGDAATVLASPFNIVLTESAALKIFGAEDPLGKKVGYQNYELTVTGIMFDIKHNSTIKVDGLVNINILHTIAERFLNKGNSSFFTYILLRDKSAVQTVEHKIADLVFGEEKKDNPDYVKNEQSGIRLKPFKSIYFDHGEFNEVDFCRHGHLLFIFIFTAIAVLILLIAVINYINLATARASLRAKEIGIRTAVGATKPQLITQFLGESLIMSVFSMLLAVIIVECALPAVKAATGITIKTAYFPQPAFTLFLIGGTVLLGLIAGIYPAFRLSAFNSASLVKGKRVRNNNEIRFRRALTVFQYAVSITIIAAAVIVHQQLTFMKTRDVGFIMKDIVYFRTTPDIREHWSAFEADLLNYPEIANVCYAHQVPGHFLMQWGRLFKGEQKMFYCLPVNDRFIDLLGLAVIAGRNFNQSDVKKKKNIFILNETAVDYFGLDEPVGKSITQDIEIIGVIKDFHFKSMQNGIEPLALVYDPSFNRGTEMAMVRMSSENIARTVRFIKKRFEEYSLGIPFEPHFLDVSFNELYHTEEKAGSILNIFSLIAVSIACLGLLGLISFNTDRRTKEIGIRKILGASIPDIVISLSKELVCLVLLANAIAWPILYFIMHKWLDNFAYRIAVTPLPFVAAGTLTLVIALLTVSFQTFRAALANPVDALRYE